MEFHKISQKSEASLMAYRRNITARAKLHDIPIFRSHEIPNYFQAPLFGTGNNVATFHRPTSIFQGRRFAIPAAGGPTFVRNMSSFGKGPADTAEIMTDVADVLGDKAVEVAAQVSPVASEVTVAAADSFLPVAAVQYLIDYVHTFTGFNWWASIVLTTILMSSVEICVVINQKKYGPKIVDQKKYGPKIVDVGIQRLEEMLKMMEQLPNMSDATADRIEARLKEIRKESFGYFHIVNAPLIVWSIFFCFFFALKTMAENVPSFEEGGALWFTDLTTPDSMYIFPILLWISIIMHNAADIDFKDYRVLPAFAAFAAFAALTIPFTATLPKAIFCYWITSNMVALAYKLALKKPEVKKLFGIPVTPPSSTNKN